MGVFYITREAFLEAAVVAPDTRVNRAVDRILEAASRLAENLTNRHFYPFTQTRYYDWPPQFGLTPIRLYLNADLLGPESAVTVTVEGAALTPLTDFFLESRNYPTDGGDQQSYSRIEIDLGNTGIDAFKAGQTPQRAIRLTGDWGYSNLTAASGSLAAAIISTSATTLQLSDSSLVGVGDLITVDTERMVVTEKALIDTTVNLGPNGMTASNADNQIHMSVTGNLQLGEIVTVDSERMYIESFTGSNANVIRAYQGSVLAAHTPNTDIYAPRIATVTRGVYGSTAATHALAAPIIRNFPPQAIADYVLAEAISTFQQERAGYARTVGQGDTAMLVTGRALSDVRNQVVLTYRRNRGPVAV